MNLTVRKTFHAPDGKGHAIAIFSLHMTRLHPPTSKIKLALRKIFLLLRADMTSSAWMMSARKSVNLEELRTCLLLSDMQNSACFISLTRRTIFRMVLKKLEFLCLITQLFLQFFDFENLYSPYTLINDCFVMQSSLYA